MALDWFWVTLGLDSSLPVPTITRAWIKSLRDEQWKRLEASAAGVREFVKLNGAYQEAKRLVVD